MSRIARRMRRSSIVVVGLLAVGLVGLGAPAPVVSAATCAETGEGCAVGMVGPRGGIVFYDAGSMQWWGRFLEAERTSTRAGVGWGAPGSIYSGAVAGRRVLQRHAMSVGMGRLNTESMRVAGSPIVAAHLPTGQDWFIPSKDELDALYNFWRLRRPRGLDYGAMPVWTSTESEDAFAWYQLFHDGTQFTDANGVLPGLPTNKDYLRSARHVGSGFLPRPMRIIRVRAFPATQALAPAAPALVAAPVGNPSCALAAIGCMVGDVGPGGGIVVYDAGSAQTWGRYLEIAPKQCESSRLQYSHGGLGSSRIFRTQTERVATKFIGAGERTTQQLQRLRAPDLAATVAWASTCGGMTDWFLPSKDELNEAFRWLSHSRRDFELTPAGQFERGYYWTSSDYNGRTAWMQYFADGQQFDRVQTLSGNRKPPARPFYVRPMRAFQEGEPGPARP
jgi:hypothetical protein